MIMKKSLIVAVPGEDSNGGEADSEAFGTILGLIYCLAVSMETIFEIPQGYFVAYCVRTGFVGLRAKVEVRFCSVVETNEFSLGDLCSLLASSGLADSLSYEGVFEEGGRHIQSLALFRFDLPRNGEIVLEGGPEDFARRIGSKIFHLDKKRSK